MTVDQVMRAACMPVKLARRHVPAKWLLTIEREGFE